MRRARPPPQSTQVQRSDYLTQSTDGVAVHVRELRPPVLRRDEPLILVHGARVSGIGSFDLAASHGSLAQDLALALGCVVLVMDARGYGASQRADAMQRPAGESEPLSRAFEVVRDVDAVVQLARKRLAVEKVTLFGWATGGMWAAYYASLWPERVATLILLNALYGGSETHVALGPGSSVADPDHPDRLNRKLGGYALYDAASLWPSWDKSIPLADKEAWRDPEVARAYAAAVLDSDPHSTAHQPPAFRAPLGAIEDSFYQASGRRIFDASQITARTLLIRSDRDFWSRPQDAESFAHDAVHAREVRVVTLPEATHYVHLDRPERGRDLLLDHVRAFLAR